MDMIAEFLKTTEVRYRALGVVDGLLLAHELLKAHPEAAVLLRVANERLSELHAALDAEMCNPVAQVCNSE